MKFKFRLEKAAHVFSQRETAKRMEVAVVAKQLDGLRSQLRNVVTENRKLFEENSQLKTESVAWIKVLTDRVEANLLTMAGIESEIEQVSEVLEVKKVELRRISQRKKALEKVREKKFQEFKIEQGRLEQKRLDENYQILSQSKE